MTLDTSQYLDPMLVLMRKEAQQARKDAQCGGCIHATSSVFKGQPSCTKKWQTYGYRCKFYQRKEAK